MLALLSSAALALPVVGDLTMTGNFTALDDSGAVVSDATQTTNIDFWHGFIGDDKFVVTSASTGVFSGYAFQAGDIKDLYFSPFGGTVSGFWSIDIFSFDLTTINIDSETDANNLHLSGTGVIHGTGYYDTLGAWNFSGDTTGEGVFSWSSTTYSGDVVDMPEPGILGLLSVGLIAFGAIRKFDRKSDK